MSRDATLKLASVWSELQERVTVVWSRCSRWIDRQSPWRLSGVAHGVIVLLIATLILVEEIDFFESEMDTLDIDIIEAPLKAPSPLRQIKVSKDAQKKTKPKPRRRKVFGATKKTLTSKQGEGLRVKAGNTVAKTPDQRKLRPGDEAPIPIPVEEYLVSSMPQLRKKVVVKYSKSLQEQGIQGAVLLDVLIDGAGRVREVALIKGIGYGLDQLAIEAMKKFRFEPAKVGDEPVAVRVRYTYRFELEK